MSARVVSALLALHASAVSARSACARALAAKYGPDVLVVEENLLIARPDVLVARLPADVHVLAPTGERIEASRGFWVSVETFDPVHLILDIDETGMGPLCWR